MLIIFKCLKQNKLQKNNKIKELEMNIEKNERNQKNIELIKLELNIFKKKFDIKIRI